MRTKIYIASDAIGWNRFDCFDGKNYVMDNVEFVKLDPGVMWQEIAENGKILREQRLYG